MKKQLSTAMSILLLLGLTGAIHAPSAQAAAGDRVTFIYDLDTSENFETLLTEAGYTVDMVPITSLAGHDLSGTDLIIAGNDSGLGSWGGPAEVAKVATSDAPVLGIGEGGANLFVTLGHSDLGYQNAWFGHSPAVRVLDLADPIWSGVELVSGNATLYYSLGLVISAFQPSAAASPVAGELLDLFHFPLVSQTTAGRDFFLWGFIDGPEAMTPAGQLVFLNVVGSLLPPAPPAPPSPTPSPTPPVPDPTPTPTVPVPAPPAPSPTLEPPVVPDPSPSPSPDAEEPPAPSPSPDAEEPPAPSPSPDAEEPPAEEPTPEPKVCPGFELDERPQIVGTPGPDVLVATSAAEIICGLGGNDEIVGKAGNDLILGGSGDDDLSGGRGSDTIFGGRGDDLLRGNAGHDRLHGGPGVDSVHQDR